MPAPHKKSQSVTPLVILFGLIGITFGFFFGIASNVYFLGFLVLMLFFISFINQDFAIIFIILSTFLLPAVKIGETALREVIVRPEDILVLVVLAGWLAKMAVFKEIGLLKRTILSKPIMAYALVCLVSTAFSFFEGHREPKDAFFFLTKYYEYYLLFFMVANNCKTLAQAKRFINFMLFTYVLVCLWGLHQIPLGNRIRSPFGLDEPNTLSGYLILMMGMNLGLLVYAQSTRLKVFYAAMLGLAILPFMYTMSRGGMLAFVPMILALIIFTKKHKALLLIGTLVLAIAIPTLMPRPIQQRLKDSLAQESSINILGKNVYIAESAYLRLKSWNRAFDVLEKRPILGVGVPGGGVIDGQFPRVMIETGLLGLVIFLWLLFSLFKTGLWGLRNPESPPFMQGISLGFTAGLTGVIFHSLSTASFIVIHIMEPFWIIAGILIALHSIEQEIIPEST